VLLVALVRDRTRVSRLLKLFMAGALITCLLGLVQYAVGVNLTDKTDGYFLYLPPRLAHWPRPILNLLAMINGRVLGTRGHPLSYAECLLFNWAIAMCLLLVSKMREAAGWVLYLVLAGSALLVSQSRGPWVAAAFIALLAMLMSPSRRGWLIFALCGVFLGVFSTVPVFRDRAVSILDRSHSSNKERLHMWRAGEDMWKSHPILGIGPGNVKSASVGYQTPEEKVWGPWGHLHSLYMNFLAERGLLGLAAFFLFIGALLLELWQAWRRSTGDLWRSSFLQAVLLGVLGFLISGLTETVYNTAVVMMTFYFVTGLALALVRHETLI
jgi:O-antigen ligase